MGDPIEFRALCDAFLSKHTIQHTTSMPNHSCALGSVKSNIGHTDAAAGVVGFIKTALVLNHGLIPPTLYFTTPNRNMDFETSPFFVNTCTLEKQVRYAGVS